MKHSDGYNGLALQQRVNRAGLTFVLTMVCSIGTYSLAIGPQPGLAPMGTFVGCAALATLAVVRCTKLRVRNGRFVVGIWGRSLDAVSNPATQCHGVSFTQSPGGIRVQFAYASLPSTSIDDFFAPFVIAHRDRMRDESRRVAQLVAAEWEETTLS